MDKDCSGFTLIELIVVLTLAGVLSAYAVVRWPSSNALILPAQADQFATDIRHAQLLAMQWGRALRLSTTSSGYSVSCVNPTASAPCNISPVIDPFTGKAFSITLDTGLSFSAVAMVDYDSLGRPVSGVNLVSTSPAVSFNMTAGTSSKSIQVSPISGFVVVTL